MILSDKNLQRWSETGSSAFVPIVKKQCTCKNGGLPDKNGIVVIDPNCLVHWCDDLKGYIPKHLNNVDERKVGIRHNKSASNS
jgi:hypothetical protein